MVMSTSEKEQLPLVNPEVVTRKRLSRRSFYLLPLIPVFLTIARDPLGWTTPTRYSPQALAAVKCPAQPSALNIGHDWNPLHDDTYASLAADRLSRSVQVPTESFDNLPVNASDPAFDKHYAFAHYLEAEFPKLYTEPVKHEIVNVHGHLFTWQGSNPDLQPILLMAHTDTVPVLPATLDQWVYPPFEGIIAQDGTPSTPGTWLWGRGVNDCKNSLMGIFGAMERLVTEGFEPERTILVANGFDEEVSASSLIVRDLGLIFAR